MFITVKYLKQIIIDFLQLKYRINMLQTTQLISERGLQFSINSINTSIDRN